MNLSRFVCGNLFPDSICPRSIYTSVVSNAGLTCEQKAEAEAIRVIAAISMGTFILVHCDAKLLCVCCVDGDEKSSSTCFKNESCAILNSESCAILNSESCAILQ